MSITFRFNVANLKKRKYAFHYNDVIMSAVASQITSVPIVWSTVCSGADHRKHQGSASLAFLWVIHWWPVNFPHKRPVTRKMFPFDDVTIRIGITYQFTSERWRKLSSLNSGARYWLWSTNIIFELLGLGEASISLLVILAMIMTQPTCTVICQSIIEGAKTDVVATDFIISVSVHGFRLR